MSNANQLTDNFQARVTNLYQSYGELDDLEGTIQAEVREIVDAILWARDRRGAAYDPHNENEWDLAYTRRKVDGLLSMVLGAILAAGVDAAEEWGGIDEAPMDYRRGLTDLRDLRGDLEALKAEVDRLCAPVDKFS